MPLKEVRRAIDRKSGSEDHMLWRSKRRNKIRKQRDEESAEVERGRGIGRRQTDSKTWNPWSHPR